MQLEEFYDYKNQLMDDLLTNAEIIRLLDDNYKDSDQPERFVYSQVFPFEYVPDTIEHGQTFICCDVDVQKSLNKTFLIPVLYVWVFTHKSKMKLPKGGCAWPWSRQGRWWVRGAFSPNARALPRCRRQLRPSSGDCRPCA